MYTFLTEREREREREEEGRYLYNPFLGSFNEVKKEKCKRVTP